MGGGQQPLEHDDKADADQADDADHHNHDNNSRNKPWPEDSHLGFFHHLWQEWTFSYMRALLRLRHQSSSSSEEEHLLTHADLYQAPRSMRAQRLHEKFWESYREQKKQEEARQPKRKTPGSSSSDADTSTSRPTTKHSYHLLLRTFWQLAKPTFIPAGVCQLISILCQVAVPLFVRQLLEIVRQQEEEESTEHNNNDNLLLQQGLPYAFAILLALLGYGLTLHKQRHWAAQTGISIRAALVVALYERILQLAPHGRYGLSNGLVATLIAVDSQKIYDVAQEGHLIWALPLAIVLVSLSLVWVMGPVTLVGIAVLVANLPLVRGITSSMLRIRTQRVALTDERVEWTNSLLRGIQVTKYNHHEDHYQQLLTDVRNQELHLLEREAAVWATTLSVSKLSAAMAAAATFACHTLVLGKVLTASTSFSVFLLFAALRFPIGYTGRLLGKLAQAKSSLERINDFLQRPVRSEEEAAAIEAAEAAPSNATSPSAGESEEPLLLVQKGSFSICGSDSQSADSQTANTAATINSDPDQDTENLDPTNKAAFTVSGLDFSVAKNEILAIVGPVGSGKSTIINGLIEEVSKTNDAIVSISGSVALAPQTPFILNATIRDNILFGRPLDEERYQAVVNACCLVPDFRALELTGGDLTEIGERGVTLSGGQKSRVGLARAAYGKPNLLLLDDPLSALDAGTAKQVFQNLLVQGDLLRDTACVLVTHASHFLNRVDRILVVVNGEGQFLGTWSELTTFECDDSSTMEAIVHLRESVQEDEDGELDGSQVAKTEPVDRSMRHTHSVKTTGKDKKALMTVEEREHGLSSVTTWLLWFKHAGGMFFFVILVFLLIADRTAYFGQEYWVAVWTEGADEPVNAFGIDFPPQTDGRSAQYKYLTAYAVILFTALACNLSRSEWAVSGGSRAARNVYTAMLKSVLHAPISFFQTTPMGRILNRFTFDMEIVDFVLTQNMSLFLVATSSYISGVAVMIGILPYVAVVLIPTTFLYCFLMWYYRKAGIDLQRLDAMSRSPIQAMVTEGMDGYTTIRVFATGSIFLKRFYAAVDTNSSSMLNYISAQRWLGTRIEVMGAFIVFIPVLLVCCLNDKLGLSSGLVGLLITASMNFTLALSFLVDFFGDAEASITAIERVDAMADLPREPDWSTKEGMLDPTWPPNGELVFENVGMRYRPDLPLALDGLSFTCPAGKRVAVCGRTGAGKSSLTVSLFRLVDIESGRILLDGVDLASIGLADVRGRRNGMSIISQDPFLTGRTVRECLDPTQSSNDMEIRQAIDAVSLTLLPESSIEEGGSNLSVGERQLLTLASALLSKPKVLVLDEATASIDGATDALIQQMLRTKFPNTTLLTIAHRLNTIMDYDFILVMDRGRAAEFGTPSDLLLQNGLFAALVDATGPESAKALRGIVETSSGKDAACQDSTWTQS